MLRLSILPLHVLHPQLRATWPFKDLPGPGGETHSVGTLCSPQAGPQDLHGNGRETTVDRERKDSEGGSWGRCCRQILLKAEMQEFQETPGRDPLLQQEFSGHGPPALGPRAGPGNQRLTTVYLPCPCPTVTTVQADTEGSGLSGWSALQPGPGLVRVASLAGQPESSLLCTVCRFPQGACPRPGGLLLSAVPGSPIQTTVDAGVTWPPKSAGVALTAAILCACYPGPHSSPTRGLAPCPPKWVSPCQGKLGVRELTK